MKLIKPSYEILEQSPGLKGIYKAIEVAGRTCYKSLNKITDDSAEGFVNRMINSKHYAMLEHGTVYLKIKSTIITNELLRTEDFKAISEYKRNPYSKVVDTGGYAYITTNMRVLQENGWLNDLKYLCEPTEYHERRVTVRFTTSNGIMREFTRHRSQSFAVESTRYCNYSKDKFNNELTFIIPSWLSIPEGSYSHIGYHNDIDRSSVIYNNEIIYWDTDSFLDKDRNSYNFIYPLYVAETNYMRMIEDGHKPQEAREVLPLATKCDMVMTGFVSDWQNFFDLRARGTTGAPHPDAKALAEPLMHEFEKRQLI